MITKQLRCILRDTSHRKSIKLSIYHWHMRFVTAVTKCALPEQHKNNNEWNVFRVESLGKYMCNESKSTYVGLCLHNKTINTTRRTNAKLSTCSWFNYVLHRKSYKYILSFAFFPFNIYQTLSVSQWHPKRDLRFQPNQINNDKSKIVKIHTKTAIDVLNKLISIVCGNERELDLKLRRFLWKNIAYFRRNLLTICLFFDIFDENQ